MWTLIITIFAINATPMNNSKGSIQVPSTGYEQCQQAREKIVNSWKVEGFRLSASCVRLPN